MRRHPIWSFVIVSFVTLFALAIVATVLSPHKGNPSVATSTTGTAQRSIDELYGQDCGGNYSPTKPELMWFYTANDGHPAATTDLLGKNAYGSLGTHSDQVACPPSWVTPIETINQLEVVWYSHACANPSPSTTDVAYFFKYLHTCDSNP
jgi:hypothetical protein